MTIQLLFWPEPGLREYPPKYGVIKYPKLEGFAIIHFGKCFTLVETLKKPTNPDNYLLPGSTASML